MCLNWSEQTDEPDFSANGSPIQVGFYRAVATTDHAWTMVTGIDNWQVTIHSVPGPTALSVLPFGALALLRRGRRSRHSLRSTAMKSAVSGGRHRWPCESDGLGPSE